MIFLMKGHTYRIVDSDAMDDSKAIKKFQKWKPKIRWVMIDCSSRLRSDTWTMVSAEHFLCKFKPIHIRYKLAMFMQDTPLDELSSFEREITVANPTDLYNVATLLHQIDYASACTEWLCQDFWVIEPLEVEIWQDGNPGHDKWVGSIMRSSILSDDKACCHEELEDLLAKYQMYIDTDRALDASMVNDDAVEDIPQYFTRYNRFDGTQQLTHYFHKRRFTIRLANGEWELVLNPSISIDGRDEFDDPNVIYGSCINHSGLVYMANPRITMGIDRITSGTLNVYQQWTDTSEARVGIELGDNQGVASYDFYSSIELLYGCLYIPQFYDLLKYFYGEQVTHLQFIMAVDKYYECNYGTPIAPTQDDMGISLDLFNIMARAVAEGYRIPTFDETRLD